MKLLGRVTGSLRRIAARAQGDRGDVPGWVMVCVMTAVLVVAILTVFEPQIKHALGGVLDSISGQ